MDEWPDTFIDWSSAITPQEIERLTLGRFQNYPFLWRAIAETLAQGGRERAFQLAHGLCQIPRYFRIQADYKRWLVVVVYREALRALFIHPSVAALLEQVTEDQVVILRYLYIDQMTYEQLGRALGKPNPRCLGEEAYDALCDHLRAQGRANEDVVPFPAYPAFPAA